jgi:hypothetical protein
MIDPVFGSESILPYSGAFDERAQLRTSWISTPMRALMYALSLLVLGVWTTRTMSAMLARHGAPTFAPVVVAAPVREQWAFEFQRDTVAEMLAKKNVDPTTAMRWAREFVYYAHQTRVSPRLLVAIAYAESEFNPRAYSRAGAVGLMQVMPSRTWWREYESRCGTISERALHEPKTNICYGAHIYREFLTRHKGDTDRALAAYNNGSGELNGYPRRVYASLAALRL